MFDSSINRGMRAHHPERSKRTSDPRPLPSPLPTVLPPPLRMMWLALCVLASEMLGRFGAAPPPAEVPGNRREVVTGGGDGGGGGGGDTEREGRGGRGNEEGAATVIFCDGVSAPVPLLRLAGPVRTASRHIGLKDAPARSLSPRLASARWRPQ